MIFGLLGLVFLGGGAWAIVDGWPYLVLERGFTQVIIGSVGATAGVILLALAWVMMELRQVKASVSSAAAALAMASLAPGEPTQFAWPPSKDEPQPVPPQLAPEPSASPAVGAAAIGITSIGAALATAGAPDKGVPETLREPHAEAGRETADPAQESHTGRFALDDAAALQERNLPPFPPRTEPVDAIDVPPIEPEYDPQPRQDAYSSRPDADVDPGEEAVAAALGRPGAGLPSDERAPAPASMADLDDKLDPKPLAGSSIWWPEINASADMVQEDAKSEAVVPSPDEPASLRDRLNVGPALPPGIGGSAALTAEPPGEADKPVTLDAAEAWMNPVFSRREPFFGEPSAEPVPGEPTWPPSQPAPELAEAGLPEHEPSSRSSLQAESLPSEAETDAQAATAAAQDAPPAASEEGVIGAYQVGEAHFTLFADGSIKARTPDGDYDFGSMDELKIYLASEKSRLGV